MKMLKKNRKLKYIAVIVLCYISASWGVNGVINPVHYIHNSNIHYVQIEEYEEYLFIDLSQVPQDNYIVFEISSLNTTMNNLDITLLENEGISENKSLKIFQGFVSYKKNTNVLGIEIAQKDIQKCEIVINQVWTSNHKMIDSMCMLKIFISFLCLVIFWDCSQIIKKKYA